MKRTCSFFIILFIVISFTSCRKEFPLINVDPTDPNLNLLDIAVPQNFKFETALDVTVSVSGLKSSQSNKVKYDIYLYNPAGEIITTTTTGDGGQPVTEPIQIADALSNLTASYITDATSFDIKVTVPNFYKSLYIIKNDRGVYSSVILPVNSNKLSAVFIDYEASFKSNQGTQYTVDMIYGVNSSSEVFQINTESGDLTIVSTIPAGNGGSHTCAIDPVKEILYAVGLNKPYNLLAYDIKANTWKTIDDTGIYGPRLAYNIYDGLLHYSYDDWIALIDPSNAKIVSTYKVKGLDNEDGGDIAFSADGSKYMSTTSGIYKLSYKRKNDYNSSLISNNLSNYPSSLAFGYDDTFWWATNINGKGQVFTFNLDNSSETSHFSPFNHIIDDMAVLPVDIVDVIDNDADGDGIIDLYDTYPNDPIRATDTYTPSITGLGSYAFEDLWPYQGDYDFNDLIVNYRFANVLNAAGLAVETRMYFLVKNVGGSFENGFGIELDMDKSLIQQVTGYHLSEGIISLNSQGLENNQAKPVIVVFDNAQTTDINSGVLQLLITYAQPIQPTLIGAFNPFIFVNGDRGTEVHLVDNKPTSLANVSLFETGNDASSVASSIYYRNSNNLPWAINILYDFTFLQEKSPINQGYTKFASWAVSGGSEFEDWFTDTNDYRNYTYLVTD